MSTAATIIGDAFREGNFVAVGETPTAEELTEALSRLNGYLSALFGFEAGEWLRDWFAPTTGAVSGIPLRSPRTPDGSAAQSSLDWTYPPPNSRIMLGIAEPATIYFPAQPSDGARMSCVSVGSTGLLTIHGNGRLVENAVSITEVTAGDFSGRNWLYRADLGGWILLKKIAADTEEVPLPEEFDDLLITGLAIRLAPRMGVKNIDAAIIGRHESMLKRLRLRYRQTEGMPISEVPVMREI